MQGIVNLTPVQEINACKSSGALPNDVVEAYFTKLRGLSIFKSLDLSNIQDLIRVIIINWRRNYKLFMSDEDSFMILDDILVEACMLKDERLFKVCVELSTLIFTSRSYVNIIYKKMNKEVPEWFTVKYPPRENKPIN